MWTVVLMLLGLMLPAAALVLGAPGSRTLAVMSRRRTPAVPCSMQCEKPCCKNSLPDTSALGADTNAALDDAFLSDEQFIVRDCSSSSTSGMAPASFNVDHDEDGEEKKREGCCGCCPPGCACCADGCRCLN